MGKGKKKGRVAAVGQRDETDSVTSGTSCESDSRPRSCSRVRNVGQKEVGHRAQQPVDHSGMDAEMEVNEVSVCENKSVPSVSVPTNKSSGVSVRGKKANRRCVYECDASVEVDEFDRVKQIYDILRGFLLEEDNRANKTSCDFILSRVSDYKRMLGKLLCVNAKLRGRLDECENERERMRERAAVAANHAPTFAQVVTSPSVGMNSVNVVRSDMPMRIPAKPSFAVIVKGNKKESNEDGLKKVVSEGGNPSVRVKAMRPVKADGIVIETASECEKKKLCASEAFVRMGLQVEEPKRMGPRLIVYDVPNEMTKDRLMCGVFEKKCL